MNDVEEEIGWSHTIKFDPNYKRRKKKKQKLSNKMILVIAFIVIAVNVGFTQAVMFIHSTGDIWSVIISEEALAAFLLFSFVIFLLCFYGKFSKSLKGVTRMTFTNIGINRYKIRVAGEKRKKHFEYEDKINFIKNEESYAVVNCEKGKKFYIPFDVITPTDIEYIKRISKNTTPKEPMKRRDVKHNDKGSIF